MEFKTKYSIGDTVYILDGYKIHKTNIAAVLYEKHGTAPESIIYKFHIYPMRKERECFATKEELIKSLSK